MNTKIVEQFEVLNVESLSVVEGGALPLDQLSKGLGSMSLEKFLMAWEKIAQKVVNKIQSNGFVLKFSPPSGTVTNE